MAGVLQNLSEIVVKSSFGVYPIKFQPAPSMKFNDSYFIIDTKISAQLEINSKRCIFIEVLESRKTLSSIEKIMVELSEKGMTKKSELVVIGGGYLQDLGTLVASLYMRGVSWSYIPTTLAAMGDSCIGGKSSINAGKVKNLAGNFYPPKEVLIDPSFISTLPNLEIIAGISEIIKICFARSFGTYSECSKLVKDWQSSRDHLTLSRIIQLSLRSKQYFVEEDEFDAGTRKLLNFGHSFGHALESASDYKIPHGVAVLIGMIAACNHPLSVKSNENRELVAVSLAFIRIAASEIVDDLINIDYGKFTEALARDKKNTNSDLVLVLPVEDKLKVVNIPFEQGALEVATNVMRLGIEMVLNEIC